MNVFKLLFMIVEKFGLVEQKDYEQMFREMNEWRMTNIHPESENKLYKWLATHGESWYVKLALALSFIPLTKWIYGILNPDKDED